ncbi:MAG: hypothetical protein V4713_07555 [Pseudomonadota bacterium]
MSTPPKGQRANYFSDEMGEEEFQQSFVKLLAQMQKATVSKYLNPENTHMFKHGGQWAHPAAPDVIPGDMKAHSAQTAVSFDKLVNHDLTVIDQVLRQLTESMERQFMQMMYSTVSAAAESVGNVVDAKAVGSTHEAIAQMLERVEFSSDKFGNVTPPTIHAGPETIQALLKSAADAPPEFHQRIEAINARKTAEALEREIQRKARFVHYGVAE